ncbi:dUTP diphosphatase [Anaeroselena agilis]|uniref:dUTP diphosphatase n=1 Tax=Anaeroselena agilis TaxID=3063788 RepID=A0ABU3NWX3_9FIRM|nr:hypothetical protein [Selenomonadales bacterium 4137-cl]
MEPIKVVVKKNQDKAVLPEYATDGAACFDLVAAETVVIPPGETKKITTGLIFEVPAGHVMRVYPRSGVSLKTPLRLANSVGIIDSDYRGEVAILLTNTASRSQHFSHCVYAIDGSELSYGPYGGIPYDQTYVIRAGERIAQGEIIPLPRVEFVENEPSATKRGKKGFGSTGT